MLRRRRRNACADYLKAGREVAIDGRLLFDEFKTQDGGYASRVYIVAERVEFLASRNRSTGQGSAEASARTARRRPARRASRLRRLTTIGPAAAPGGRGPDDFRPP